MSLKEFKVVAKLGEGSYSTVYKVLRLSDGIEYAMKKVEMRQMNDAEKTNALNEVRILASLQNQNVIEFKEAFLEDKCLYIIMEYASGGDLKRKIKERKGLNLRFQEDEIWEFVRQIASGLRALHDRRVIHCDMKSANVFITESGYKLADMNVSKVNKSGLIHTQTGTPYYASPEVWRDEPYDNRSDIWSLGIIIYEMAALKLPFNGTTPQQLFDNIQSGTYSPLPYCYSKDLSTLIAECINVDPLCRPSCEKILANPKFKANEEDNDQSNLLLDTIRLSDFQVLKSMLPKPKYGRSSVRKSASRDQSPGQQVTKPIRCGASMFDKDKSLHLDRPEERVQRQRIQKVDYKRNFASPQLTRPQSPLEQAINYSREQRPVRPEIKIYDPTPKLTRVKSTQYVGRQLVDYQPQEFKKQFLPGSIRKDQRLQIEITPRYALDQQNDYRKSSYLYHSKEKERLQRVGSYIDSSFEDDQRRGNYRHVPTSRPTNYNYRYNPTRFAGR